jgi:hypothetical protein
MTPSWLENPPLNLLDNTHVQNVRDQNVQLTTLSSAIPDMLSMNMIEHVNLRILTSGKESVCTSIFLKPSDKQYLRPSKTDFVSAMKLSDDSNML